MASTISISGSVRVPGDKSITHRALMLAALAPGRSVIGGALTSLDARSTARVLRALGATISPLTDERVVMVTGRKRLTAPKVTLNAGNSGTTARLMAGILAAHPFASRLTGDASLRKRPMKRVTTPLIAMGAKVEAGANDGLPLTIRGGKLHEISYALPVASAQIKSALLLAAAVARVTLTIDQPGESRDHTERMLRHLGFEITAEGLTLNFQPTGRFSSFEIQVPGDPSSAAFLVAAAVLADTGELSITGVGLNPSRTGFIDILRRMGAVVDVTEVEEPFGEPIGTIVARPANLRAVDVAAEEIPAAIDEIPILACLAARAKGVSRFRGLAELRVKESDRLNLIAANLRAVGTIATVEGDDLLVQGSDLPFTGRVITSGDHRIAMAFGVLNGTHGAKIRIDDPDCADVSFPRFAKTLATIRKARK